VANNQKTSHQWGLLSMAADSSKFGNVIIYQIFGARSSYCAPQALYFSFIYDAPLMANTINRPALRGNRLTLL